MLQMSDTKIDTFQQKKLRKMKVEIFIYYSVFSIHKTTNSKGI